jgi:hypothetical protein
MANLVNLTAISGDKQFSLNWDHVILGVGDTTKFSIVTITNKTVGNTITSHKLTYYNNPLTGTFLLDNLEVGTEYLVAVVQYTSLGLMYASTPIPLSVSSSPDAVELRQGDINTVNDLTSITIQTHFPTNYSNGGSLLTKIQFTVASEDLFYNYLFDKNNIDDLYELVDLAPNQSYEIAASAMNSIGISDLSNTIFESTSGYPQAPRDFTISTSYLIDADKTSVLLTWKPPNNADLTDLQGYKIKYKLHSDIIFNVKDFTEILPDQMSYTFLNEFTTYGETYDFQIVSYNSLDISLQQVSSPVLNAYVFKNALSVQTATSVPDNSSLHLAWVAPSSLRGYALDNYCIKVYTGDSATGLFNTFYTKSTEYSISGLNNGQNMCVVILAQTKNTVTNEIIDGASVTIVSTVLNNMTATPFTNPTVPLSVSVVPRNGDIKLDWSAPNINGGFPISYYVVSYKLHSASDYTERDAGNVLSYIIPGLTNGTSYDVILYAVNSATSTIYSTNKGTQFDQPNIKPYTSSNAISGLVIAPSDLKLDCAWVVPSENGGFVVDYYKVYINDFHYADSSTTNIALTGLSNGTSYKVKIVPYTKVDYLTDDLIGTSYESEGYYPYKPASLVNNLKAVPTDKLVTLSWDPPSDPGGFAIAKYSVSYGTTTTYETGTTIAIDAINGEDITYIVTPVTININPLAGLAELPGASEPVLSRAYTRPNPIPNLQVIPRDSNIKLLFPSSDYSGGYTINKYQISHKKSTDSLYTDVPITTGELVYEAGDIMYSFSAEIGVGYDIKIAVFNSVPNLVNSKSIDVTSVNQIPYRKSSVVTNLHVTASNQQLAADWGPPSEKGGFEITDYQIYLGGTHIDTVVYTTTNYNFTGLTNGTYYTVSIIPVTIPAYTVDQRLLGDRNIASDIKPYTNPDPVNNLAAAEKDKEIILSWTAPANTGGNIIVGYSVMMLDASGFTMLDHTINDASILNYTFNNANVNVNGRLIVNGDTYTLKCKVITKTDSNELLYSSYQSIPANPFGLPYNISYTINTNTNEIAIEVNNNGNHLTGLFICAPPSVDSTIGEIARILVTTSITDPVFHTSNPLIDTYSHVMNYQLDIFTQQPMLIVATNAAGVSYTQNFAGMETVNNLI